MCSTGNAKRSACSPVFYHAVTDAGFGKNILRLARIFFELAADVCHIDAQDFVAAVHIRAPDILHNGAVSQYFAGMLCQVCDNIIFDRCQVQLAAG